MQVRQISNTNPNPQHTEAQISDMFDKVKSNIRSQVQPEPKEENLLGDDATIAVTKDVPSKMLPYPKGSSIKYKPFTYGQLLKFNSSSLSETDKVRFVLDGITTTGFEKSNLSYADFLFIALLRKLTAFNDAKFKYRFVCDDCGHANDIVSELSKIEFKELEVPSLPLIVDVDDTTNLQINPMTIGSYVKLREIESDDSLMAYAECVINMPSEQAYNIINNAHGDLIDVLEEADRMLGFGTQTLDCKCSNCGELNTFPLGGIQDLIMPFRESRESAKARIRFQ